MNKKILSGNYKKVGEKIKILRNYLEITREEFAKKVGFSSSHLSRIENGQVEVREVTVEEICRLFDVNSEYFMSEQNNDVAGFVKSDAYDGLSVSERLKKEREERNFTQAYLAEISGVQQSLISMVETKEKRLTSKQAEKIAGALGVGTEYLLTGDLRRKNYPVNKEMIDWLWEHPEERKRIWDKLKEK